MARKKKQTVDYFPHNCKHGKTIFILEKKYGNDGYAFWFKLLEELGSSEGHFIDLNDEIVLEFLSAKMMIPTPEMIDMLNLLSKLGNIDKELWSKKIIWCANFVSNVAQVYDKRVVSVPEKPISDDGKPISDDGKPQSKVKYSKVNNIYSSSKMSESDFETFWLAYPKKVSKSKAKKKFLKLDKDILPSLLKALEEQKQTDQWEKKQFIPYPTTWLNGERWEDEIGEGIDYERKAIEYSEKYNTNAYFKFEKSYGTQKANEYIKILL